MMKIDETNSLLDVSEDLLEELISVLSAHLEIFKNSGKQNSSSYFALSHLVELSTELKEFDLTPEVWQELFWSGLFFLDTCKETSSLGSTVELDEMLTEFRRKITEPARISRSECAAERKNKVLKEYSKLQAANPEITKDKAAEIISNIEGSESVNLSFGRIRKLLHNK